MTKIFTIGVYGFTETKFFDSLSEFEIDTFFDIRARRGLRGAKYKFANSIYLQTKLEQMNINYAHLKSLAPGSDIRALQHEVDKETNIAKRDRTQLSDAFITAYQESILQDFDADKLLSQFNPLPNNMVLFCVEKEPGACHRSIVAAELCKQLEIKVEHILP